MFRDLISVPFPAQLLKFMPLISAACKFVSLKSVPLRLDPLRLALPKWEELK